MCVANWHWSNILQQVSKFGEDSTVYCYCKVYHFTVFPAHKRTAIFSLEILEKDNNKFILILVLCWKKAGLLHTKISNHNIIYSS